MRRTIERIIKDENLSSLEVKREIAYEEFIQLKKVKH